MIRTMMWSPRDGDKLFIDTMHDFISTYRLQAATTEDFKAILEKHMVSQMNVAGNGKMDWFFNEYVYGTELPAYHFEQQIAQDGDAQTLHFKLAQSGVSKDFVMAVPLYLELGDGRVVRWASARVTGPTSIDQTVPLPKTPSPVKRALINYNYDVLSTED